MPHKNWLCWKYKKAAYKQSPLVTDTTMLWSNKTTANSQYYPFDIILTAYLCYTKVRKMTVMINYLLQLSFSISAILIVALVCLAVIDELLEQHCSPT